MIYWIILKRLITYHCKLFYYNKTYSDLDKGRTLSTFIYFNKLIKDEEREISAIQEIELSHIGSIVLTCDQKSFKADTARQNPRVIYILYKLIRMQSDEDIFTLNKQLEPDIKQKKIDSTVKNNVAIDSMPLQRFAYEDLGNSQDKVNIN